MLIPNNASFAPPPPNKMLKISAIFSPVAYNVHDPHISQPIYRSTPSLDLTQIKNYFQKYDKIWANS